MDGQARDCFAALAMTRKRGAGGSPQGERKGQVAKPLNSTDSGVTIREMTP